MSKSIGVISMGIKAPIIRQGDDLKQIVIESMDKALKENGMQIQDGDVIGITESVVARAQGNYVTIDDIVQFLEEHNFKKKIALVNPIMSRNRFSMILKAFARYADTIFLVTHYNGADEVGNPTTGVNPFTGVDILSYYKELCENEHCEFEATFAIFGLRVDTDYVNAMCHPETIAKFYGDGLNIKCTLADIMNEPVKHTDGTMSGYNADWGLLGSNKANEETLKLFPRKDEAQALVDSIQEYFTNAYGVAINVLVFGDGCFCSPKIPGVEGSQIYEFADPVTCPAFSRELDGLKPNEIKIKNLADDKYRYLNGKELEEAINREIEENKGKNLVGCMSSQGTTPRRVTDLLASLFDLTTGSGSRSTPIVYCHGYLD